MLRLSVLVAVALSPAIVRADDWATTFEASAVASHLDGTYPYVVVGFGSGGSEASDAFAAALESSGRADVCLPASNIGALEGLDDPAVVQRASVLPVKRVAIARVFGERVVVTVFRTDGTAVVAIAGAKGKPLKTRAGRASDGVDASTATTVASVTRGDDASKAQEEYDQKFIASTDVVAVDRSGVVVANTSTYYRGKYKEALDLPQVFEAIGDRASAQLVRDHVATKSALFVGGLAGMSLLPALGFIPYLALAPSVGYVSFVCFDRPDPDQCRRASDATEAAAERQRTVAGTVGGVVGGVIFIAGAVSFFVSATMKPAPIEPQEIRRRIDEHNKKLKQDLGLEHGSSDATPAQSSALDIHATFVPMSGGGFAALQVSF